MFPFFFNTSLFILQCLGRIDFSCGKILHQSNERNRCHQDIVIHKGVFKRNISQYRLIQLVIIA